MSLPGTCRGAGETGVTVVLLCVQLTRLLPISAFASLKNKGSALQGRGRSQDLSPLALWLHLCFCCFSKIIYCVLCTQDWAAGTDQDLSRGRADCFLRGFPQRERGAAEAAEEAILFRLHLRALQEADQGWPDAGGEGGGRQGMVCPAVSKPRGSCISSTEGIFVFLWLWFLSQGTLSIATESDLGRSLTSDNVKNESKTEPWLTTPIWAHHTRPV